MELSEIGVIVLLILIVLAISQTLRLLWLVYAPTGEPRTKRTDVVLPDVPQSNVPSVGRGNTFANGTGKRIEILGGLKQQTMQLPPDQRFSIGRFQNMEQGVLVALDDRSISRRHALFDSNDALGEYYLMDTKSSYGTYIQLNNEFTKIPAEKRERIYNEDIIRFGNNVVVRFNLPGDTRASSTQL